VSTEKGNEELRPDAMRYSRHSANFPQKYRELHMGRYSASGRFSHRWILFVPLITGFFRTATAGNSRFATAEVHRDLRPEDPEARS